MPLSIKCTYFKAKIHQFSPLQTLHRNITFPLLTRPPVGVSSGQHLHTKSLLSSSALHLKRNHLRLSVICEGINVVSLFPLIKYNVDWLCLASASCETCTISSLLAELPVSVLWNGVFLNHCKDRSLSLKTSAYSHKHLLDGWHTFCGKKPYLYSFI